MICLPNKLLIVCLTVFILLFCVANQSSAASWPTVGRGDLDLNNVNVTMIQYLLREKGLSVTVDGRFGVQTQQRVQQFQREHGMQSTGQVDKYTWKRLIVVLKQGDRGFAVKAMQAALQQYIASTPVNGHFDKRTMHSLQFFERTHHIVACGSVNPQIWLRLTDSLPD